MLRGLSVLILLSLLRGQDAPKPVADTFFSGTVVALSDTQVTVRRRALVSNATTQMFAIDSETKIEGKLRVRANVTVRYVTDDDGRAKALSIVVR
jgi:hypothetical protein